MDLKAYSQRSKYAELLDALRVYGTTHTDAGLKRNDCIMWVPSIANLNYADRGFSHRECH